jgi:heme exporter protein A
MIEAHGLSKRLGGRWVLRGLDLQVNEGEAVALLGPNGAGKTTLLRLLASLAKPSLGEIRGGGLRLPQDALAWRARLGFLGHRPMLYQDLTAEQNLQFFARLYALPDAQTRIDEVLEQVGLARRRREPLRVFSRGMLQRLAIARAILHRPRVLLLDEPHTGLDLDGAAQLDDLLRSLIAAGSTLLFSSHDLARAQQLADRVALLVRGQIAASWPRGAKAGDLESLYRDVVKESVHAG